MGEKVWIKKAFSSGELTKAQYKAALVECNQIIHDYCENIRKTDEWCAQVRQMAEERIAAGETVKLGRETDALEKQE